MSAQFQHDPALLTGAAAALETAINRALELAPASQRELAELSGVVLAVECTAPALEVFITVTDAGTLRLATINEGPVNSRVRGELEDFIALATADDPAATLINSKLELVGNTGPLMALQQILSRMDLDWEAPLVNVLGDVLGHQLAQLLRGSFRWGAQTSASLRRQLSEYILEEGRLSPPAAELEHFYREVENLQLRVERLDSKLQRLARRLSSR